MRKAKDERVKRVALGGCGGDGKPQQSVISQEDFTYFALAFEDDEDALDTLCE